MENKIEFLCMTNVILLTFCFDWNPKFDFDTLLIVALSQGQNV